MCVVMDDTRQSGGKEGSEGRREEERYNNLKVRVRVRVCLSAAHTKEMLDTVRSGWSLGHSKTTSVL